VKLLQQVAIEPAEENFGRLLRDDFASLDQSLKRMGLEYVDIFYSHRVDERTPMEETAAALAQAVQSGKALYIGISSYSTERTQQMVGLLREWKIPLLIHQPSYNLLKRWVDNTGLTGS